MEDYGEMVRGARYPPGDDPVTVTITKPSGWPVLAPLWTWELLISRTLRDGTPDLTIASASAAVVGTVMTLTFVGTPAETATAPDSTKPCFNVDVRSTDGAGVPSIWKCVRGTVNVRDYAGEG